METFDHVLPKWFLRFNATVGLTGLLIAEMYLLGNMFVYGWIHDVGNIQEYLNLQGAGVPIFFIAGVSLGGIGILASAASAMCFTAGKKGRGFLLLIGALLFMLIEIWASVSERSQNVPMTNADIWLLNMVHDPGALLSPTLIAIAFALPFGSFLFAFVQVKAKEDHLTPEQQARELAMLEFKQKKRAIQAKGLVKLAQTAVNTARGIEETPDETPAIEEAITEQTGELPAIKQAGIPPGMMTAKMLQSYVKREYNLEMPDAIAKGIIGTKKQANQAQGQPYMASKQSAQPRAKAWAMAQKPSSNITPFRQETQDKEAMKA